MKPGLFTFLGDEFENVFHYSDIFLPGIERIVGIFYSQHDRVIKIISRKRDCEIDHEYEQVLQNRENLVMIQKYRTVFQPFNWIKKSDLPFELPNRQKIAPATLFSELENVILVLRFTNESDQLNDLLLIYFNQNLSNFGLNKSDKSLSADHKSIIGHLLYYQFKSFLKMNKVNRGLLKTLNNVTRSVIHENISLKDQLCQVRMSYGDNIASIARLQLQDLSVDFRKTYQLTDEALEKIRGFKGNLKHLPVIVKNAVIFTENLLLPEDTDPVFIQAYCLDFESFQVEEKSSQLSKKIDSRQSRAIQLLDKLESAALILKSKNIPLISSNVAKALEPAISAPAITDSLNKSRDPIRILLDKYPEKWEIIRREFKPLLNQLRKDESENIRVEIA